MCAFWCAIRIIDQVNQLIKSIISTISKENPSIKCLRFCLIEKRVKVWTSIHQNTWWAFLKDNFSRNIVNEILETIENDQIWPNLMRHTKYYLPSKMTNIGTRRCQTCHRNCINVYNTYLKRKLSFIVIWTLS